MNSAYKISIITVAYNAEQFIERTLLSVIEQTYENIEYIIIDGKSKDNTLTIVNKYKDNISKIISEPDKSLYDAMNKGIAAATGDYIWFMNAGDRIFTKNTLSHIMENSNGEDFIYGNYIMVDEAGNTFKGHKEPPLDTEISARSFMNGMVVCHQSMLVKRSIAEQYDLVNWKISADIDWCIRTLKNAKTFKLIPEIWCWFLTGGVSDTSRFKSNKERFKIAKKHFGLLAAVWSQFKAGIRFLKKKIVQTK